MGAFATSDLVWIVFYEPGQRAQPIAILVGQGAQGLMNDLPQLSAILTQIGVKARELQLYSGHAEALLLHTRAESPANVVGHYNYALQLVHDLWDDATVTPLRQRTVELSSPGLFRSVLQRWLQPHKLPPLPRRQLYPCPAKLFHTRFPAHGKPPTPLDHGRWLHSFGLYEKSCALLERHLVDKPDDAPVLFQLGMMRTNGMQQPERGIEYLRRAAELAPDEVRIWNGLGMALQFHGDGVEACTAFKRAAALSDTFEEWINVGMSSLENGLIGSARAAASRAQERAPTEPMPLFVLAVCARRDENEEEAARMLKQAEVALERRSAEVQALLAATPLIMEARGKARSEARGETHSAARVEK